MITGQFYSSGELQALLKISKQRVVQLAREHNWDSPHPGLYSAADVTEYLWSRWRKELAAKMGLNINGLVTHDDWDRDDNCPTCGAFAIWKPATPEEIANLDKPVYNDGWPWLCVNGHHE